MDTGQISCNNQQQSYTVREAAKALRVGKSTLYDAIDRGEVPTYRIGKATRIPGHFVNSKLSPAV